MSFRGDDQRRYGSIPPVQYPVAGRYSGSNPSQQQQDSGRRPSFDSGDDAGYYGQDGAPRLDEQQHRSGGTHDELFLGGPQSSSSSSGGGGQYQQQHQQHYSPHNVPQSASSPLAGYQHRFQDSVPATPTQSSYNPQTFSAASNFNRSQSTTLPYHPHPSTSQSPSHYAAPTNTYSTSPQTTYPTQHQTYNPAAYANTAAPQRQQTYHGYSSYEQNYSSQQTYGQSPATVYSPAFSQQTQSPSMSSGYQQPLHSPSSTYATPPPSHVHTQGYDPSHYAAGQNAGYPSNGNSPGPTYGSSQSAPYPNAPQIPVGPEFTANDDASYQTRPARSDSLQSRTSASYVQPLSSSGLQRHPTGARLPRRPVEQDNYSNQQWNTSGSSNDNGYGGNITTDSIIEEIEAELGGAGHGHSNAYSSGDSTPDQDVRRSPNRSYRHPGYPTDDDDPEGSAGLMAMRQAEVDDQRYGNSFGYADMPAMPGDPRDLPTPSEEQGFSSDSDFGGIDLGILSGGYAGNLTYGADLGAPPGSSSSMQDPQRPLPTPGYFNSLREDYQNAQAFNHAEMDYGGTGGLQQPTEHRLSFDDGEERMSLHSRQSGNESPAKEDYQDLFYHPGLTHRPLPKLPPGPESDSSSLLSAQNSMRQQQRYHQYSQSADARAQPAESPEAYYANANNDYLQPERSISLSGHSTTPSISTPARSRTDAAEERRKAARGHQHASSFSGPSIASYDSSATTIQAPYDAITLPTGRKRKFIPSKLGASDFLRCHEPWALSNVEAWLRDMACGETDLRGRTVDEGLTVLFTNKVPTMNVADAEALSATVRSRMLGAGVLLPDEEWVKFGHGHISGVLWQLTGTGCYAPKLHERERESPGRCYAYHCTRTLKKVNLDDVKDDAKAADDWHIFYGLSKEQLDEKPKKEVERQNILHEVVTGEEYYIKQLDIFRTLYRDDLRTHKPPIIHPDKRDKFLASVFGKVDTVMQINKGHLLAQLKYRQQEQGPWISGFSDIFREWVRKAKAVYIDYATGYPRATYMVRKEASRNLLFKKFLEDKQRHKSSSKQDWTHFLITPLQRLQRYILLLETVERKMVGDSEEKTNLLKAIGEIKLVTHECDAKVAETNKRVEMMELDRMLVLRPGFQSVLNLDHLGRALIMQGELQRLGSKGMRWVDTHALLFDHYLILAKVVSTKDGRAEKKFDVSREPIPMPLLFLDSNNDEPIIKQKGITAPLGRTAPAGAAGAQLRQVASNGSGRPGLEHTASSNSANALTAAPSNDPEGKILYPFRVKHLGHEVYTLYAATSQSRMEWCNKIVEAKTMHAKALFSQNAEPFRLRVLADASFHYDATSVHARTASVPVKGTPLDRAIQDIESVLGSAQGIAAACRAQVNCAAGFSAFGKAIIAIGTDYGVFISDPSNPRGWQRTVQATRVTQIAVLEDFNVCLIIADKALISYPLDVVAPVSDFAPPGNDSARRAPQRLAKDVTYFATARMKDRTLVFYKRKEGLHTTFRVLEPLHHKATEKKTRLFGGRKSAGGSTDTFRDFDEFVFPVDCYSLSVFQTYIAVATAKGVEMLTLDRKQPMSIPDLKAPAIANIASRIRDQKPLGMFRLNENEFLLTYEDCAVYVDKHGDVSRTLIMEYTGKQKKARGATMYGQYLLLFNEDYVEVRNADNGRLRQIISGRDVRVIDFGIRGPTGGNAAQSQHMHGQNGQLATAGDTSKGTVKIAMAHPEVAGRQVVLEMLLNDGHSES